MGGGYPPDVTGWILAEAKEKLSAAGWAIESIALTLAPQRVAADDGAAGCLRVARQRVVGEGRVALVVVREGEARA